ncbi:Tripartite-type tricarboxylate transporter, receptor component TctC [Halopseudomonas litoralis]|uniref:Tripartite-type tricarboxylate transporter, receptor component TctC n=1 Tax=Halopseudomonas litoralis TaxID=797277 RepID=A0A1H1X0R2_9GAMM|nr:tripartite tricarboxylate transporter substrate binding protein [Halopseudomonas litoralis]SDT02691.1 Tripartite-type tricarboxylate transporter, receptor component TctC [Halopseudomonas litoralis]
MKKLLRVTLAAALGGALALPLMSASVQAKEDWPTDTVRLVVPYAAGGTTDVLSRRVAELLQRELGNVVVENRPGAGSTTGTGRLARGGRDADHTLLMASPGHTIGAAIYPGLRYNPTEDFTFIQNIIDIPNVMVVPADSPYQTVQEFVEAARKENKTFSSSGVGSSIHMSGELFKSLTETKMTHVPFRGSGEALPALLSGDVDVSFENMPTVLSHIQSGSLRALAVTSLTRSEYLPDVPTLDEIGEYNLEGFNATAWFGLIAHKSFPDVAVEKVHAALDKIMKGEDFLSFIAQLGAEPGQQSDEEFKAFIADEVQRWKKVAAQAHLTN